MSNCKNPWWLNLLVVPLITAAGKAIKKKWKENEPARDARKAARKERREKRREARRKRMEARRK